jgi:hypothetical protein
VVTLSTAPLPGNPTVDLYAAIRLPGGTIVFVTGDPFAPFSQALAIFQPRLVPTRNSYEVLNAVISAAVPDGLYTFLAAFIRQGQPPTIENVVGPFASIEVTVSRARPPAAGVGAISGSVRDAQTGTPLAGAAINVSGSGGDAVTDAAGNFAIRNVPAGTYTVTASLAGPITAARAVTVGSDPRERPRTVGPHGRGGPGPLRALPRQVGGRPPPSRAGRAERVPGPTCLGAGAFCVSEPRIGSSSESLRLSPVVHAY